MMALQQMDQMPADLPAHRAGIASDYSQPSLEDIMMMRRPNQGPSLDPRDDFPGTAELMGAGEDPEYARASGAYDRLADQQIDPRDVQQQPKPGTPEFYDWLMGRIG